MDKLTLSYLAGAIDADGYIGIRKSTYRLRKVKDCINPGYSERVALKQITTQVPELLKSIFGGHTYPDLTSNKSGKPFFVWEATDLTAATACRLLLPFLRIKHEQAQLVLDLAESKNDKYRRLAYWFVTENPRWKKLPMLTSEEVESALGYAAGSLRQAVSNGTIVALPSRRGSKQQKRFPALLIQQLSTLTGGKPKTGSTTPLQLVEWRDRLYQKIKTLNSGK